MLHRLLRGCLWFAGFGCLWLPVLDDPPLRTEPYLQAVDGDAATVAMITAEPQQLRCVVRDERGTEVASAADELPRRRHALRLGGLTPGRDYTYEVTGAGEPRRGRLRTAPAGDAAPVRFAFLGDSGAQPWWVWLQRSPLWHLPAAWQWLPPRASVAAVGREVAAWQPDFLLHLGDVIYPRGQHAHYASGFFQPFAAVLREAPCYAVVGNHDAMDADGQQILANLPQQPNDLTGDARCLSFARGPVRVIGFDANPDYGGGRLEPGHPGLEFVRRELANCREPWVVVASHFPMRSASRQRDRADLLLHLLPLLREHAVGLYLSGHDHCYQRFLGEDAGDVHLVVSGGGGKDLYEVRPHPKVVVEKSEHHWCSAEVVGRDLQVVAHAVGGGELDRFAVPLPEGERLARLRGLNAARAARIEAVAGGR